MAFNISGTLADQIADYITEKIVRLEIPPGERILEQSIAEELGVSRSPVREAMRILEKTGMIEIVPRCGARVKTVTRESIEGFCDVFSLLFGHVVRR